MERPVIVTLIVDWEDGELHPSQWDWEALVGIGTIVVEAKP